MFLASDNAGPAHPSILDAMVRANSGYEPSYGGEACMMAVRDRLREIFEAPEAEVYLVATGTAANVLSLATLAEPWQAVYCSPVAHINEDECNAPEFYMGAGKLMPVGDSDKIAPEALRAAIGGSARKSVHEAQPGPLSITQVTEKGRIYTLDEIRTLAGIAREAGLPVHMDGARFANAVVSLGCTPAEMTWKAGVDVLSFGGTKNGCAGVEAVILFDPKRAWEFELRRKRGAHLFSKHRYLSAQMQAYLTNDLWLEMAAMANARMAFLAEGLRGMKGVSFLQEPAANLLFAALPRAAHQRLFAAGARYYLSGGPLDEGDPDEPLLARFVADWSLPEAEVQRFLEIAGGA